MDFKIPPLPRTLGEVLKVLAGEASTPDTDRLISLVKQDPALTGYVLRRVNSSYYGVRHHVTEARKAVQLLGFKEVAQLVITAALHQNFSYLEHAEARHAYAHTMRVSMASAHLAQQLTVHLKLPVADLAFTAAMLHQLGRLIFLYNAPDRYLVLWGNVDATGARPPSREQERDLFQTDYAKLGGATLQEWGTPGELVTIIDHLHVPEEVTTKHVRLVALIVSASALRAEALFEAVAAGQPASQAMADPPDPLVALAQMRNRDLGELSVFFDTQCEGALQFANAVLTTEE